MTIRNALASAVDTFRLDVVLPRRQLDGEQQRLLNNLLGVSDAPEEELMGLETLRLQGSCEWLLGNQNFQPWRDSAVTTLYWISAKPATGKSVLSGYVVNHLKDLNRDCAYYFFGYSDKLKTTISGCLRSLAWQMAVMHPDALATVLEVCEKDDQVSKADHRIVWRKLFLDGIFRLKFDRPQYWIIDALDECKADHELVPLLLKAAEMGPVRIFLTSRSHITSYRQSAQPIVQVLSEEIRAEDTNLDIALYLEAHMDQLPTINRRERQHMVTEILRKSVGCFLWVSLVLQELRQVHTSAEIRQVLEEVPSDMDAVYLRILETMSKAPYGKILIKAILVWVVCSARPLTVQELHDALQIDIRDTIDSIERCITTSCGQLVYIDMQSRVQMVHQTARDFLLRAEVQSEFTIERKSGHKRLAMTCLQYLNGNEMKGPRHRKLSVSNIFKQRSSFKEYACTAFFEHIAHVSSTDDEFLAATAKFLNSSNVLSWIEHIAQYSDLARLSQTGKALEKYLQRRSKHMSPFGKEVALLASWATDLIRIVTKFGKNLADSPASIFHLIPPFCPPETAPKRQFAASTRSITVLGLSAMTWDDCVSTIVYPQEQASALASSDLHFAIGLSTGRIIIYHDTTCQEVHVFQHHEPVRTLQFGATGNLLASAGNKILRVWNLASWQQLWEFKISQLCMSLVFADDDNLLLGALKSNTLMFWDLTTGELRDSSDWTQDLEGPNAHAFRRPTVAAFGMQSSLLAIVYRGQDILLWDLERDSLYETYSKGAGAGVGRRAGNATVWSLVFSTAPAATLLAASYSDGDLLLFDVDDGTIKETRLGVNAQTLACSSDGRTLATGDSAGTIQIFDFETLKVVYRIKSADWGIKSLVFSSDCRRLIDIRGFHARVWDPPALVRQEPDEELSDTVSISTAPQEIVLEHSAEVNLITSLACHKNAGVFLCGKENGTIGLYDTRSGHKNQDLFYHATGCSIEHMYLDDDSLTVSSIDSSSRLMTHRLSRGLKSWNTSHAMLDHRIGISVQQLLSNKGHTRLLVSSFGRDTLWSIAQNESTVVKEQLWESRGPFRWMTHPEIRDQLILVSDNVAHLYDWSTLSRLTEDEGILMEGAILPELAILSMVPCFNGKYIATTFSKPTDSTSKSRLLLWNTADFSSKSQLAAPSPHYQALADHITFLIGQYGHRLVFLHRNGWIFSAGPDAFNLESCVKHFFIPADWLTTNNGDLMIEMCQNGDLIFIKGDEPAVIKRGLDQFEQGSSASSGKRPSLTVPSLR